MNAPAIKFLYGREDTVARIAQREGKSRVWVNSNRVPAPSPEFDADGYPTEATLKTIQEWSIRSNFTIQDLLDYVEKAWRYNFIVRSGGRGQKRFIYIATSGWSGNESLVEALQQNRMFWALCWLESHRGGGYKFLTAPIAESP